ncbi:MAG: biopolymer transporter ExbD [Mucilaginibacter sp.]
MAELDTSGGGKKGGGKVRSKKQSTRVDLTAMVDLAFLLITFFILTTTLQKPKAMDLVMPDKDEKTKQQLPVKQSTTMTILLGSNNQLEWFVGIAGATPPTKEGYGKNGIRATLFEQAKKIKATTGEDMMVIIKPSDKSNYNNMVSVMDELNITGNIRRAIVDITPADIGLLKRDGIY